MGGVGGCGGGQAVRKIYSIIGRQTGTCICTRITHLHGSLDERHTDKREQGETEPIGYGVATT